jgi:spore germination protein KA
VPVNFFTFFHFVEDYSTQVILSNFVRLIRFLGLAVSLSLSSLYIALSYFHPEAIPTKLAIAIEGYREKVPFPIIAELCAMEIAFEMIREAGLRVPGILGSTITIVGAIIIGQAAVTANLVSPIAVVLVSLTALASFATPDYRMESVFRMIRFTFIFLAYFLGLEGISIGIFLLLLYLSSIRSFGVPYFTPWGSKSFGDWDTVFKTEAFKKELRPGYFHPQDTVSQPDISREWDFKGKGEQEK